MLGWIVWWTALAWTADNGPVVDANLLVLPEGVRVEDAREVGDDVLLLQKRGRDWVLAKMLPSGQVAPESQPVELPAGARSVALATDGHVLWRDAKGDAHSSAGESLLAQDGSLCAGCELRAWDRGEGGLLGLWSSATEAVLARADGTVLVRVALKSPVKRALVAPKGSGAVTAFALDDGWHVFGLDRTEKQAGCADGPASLSANWFARVCGEEIALVDLSGLAGAQWSTELDLGPIAATGLYEEPDGGVTLGVVAERGSRILTWPVSALGPVRWAMRPMPGTSPMRWPEYTARRDRSAWRVLRLRALRAFAAQGVVVSAKTWVAWGQAEHESHGMIATRAR